jgi:hypothetical protein
MHDYRDLLIRRKRWLGQSRRARVAANDPIRWMVSAVDKSADVVLL